MKHLSTTSEAEIRRNREAAALRRLFALNDREQAVLTDTLRQALTQIAQSYDLSNDLWSLLGPKAEALPDVVIALYLREVGSFTKDEFAEHLSVKVEAKMLRFYLRQMGIADVPGDTVLVRPRVFPRALMAQDLAHTAGLGRATVHRALQFLAQVDLTCESEAGPNGALDLQVKRTLLILVEEVLMSLPTIEPEGYRLDIPRKLRSPICVAVLALIVAVHWAGMVRASEPLGLTAEVFGVTLAQPCLEMPVTCAATPVTPQFAALRDVLQDGRRLLGPTPAPAPIDPNQLAHLAIGATMIQQARRDIGLSPAMPFRPVDVARALR